MSNVLNNVLNNAANKELDMESDMKNYGAQDNIAYLMQNFGITREEAKAILLSWHYGSPTNEKQL